MRTQTTDPTPLARVLFVDDETQVLDALRQALRRQPFEIHTATSGTDGLEVLGRVPIDVVVSDERMPGMAGSQFLAHVCAAYPNTVRIILTGQADLEAAVRAINDGQVYRYLRKPCDPLDLACTIHSAMQVARLRRESVRLLAEARDRGSVLNELERQHPGITQVRRTRGGTIELNSDDLPDLETLIAEIRDEVGPADPERERKAG